MSVRKGEDAALTLVVCADPRPRHVAWEWGSLRVEAGAGYGIYIFLSSISNVILSKWFNLNNHNSNICDILKMAILMEFLLFINSCNFLRILPFLSLSERYKVDEVSQDSREDCYLATLHIVDTNVHDSRPYYLVVENERGVDRHAINLVVEGMFTGAFLNFFSINYFFICLFA